MTFVLNIIIWYFLPCSAELIPIENDAWIRSSSFIFIHSLIFIQINETTAWFSTFHSYVVSACLEPWIYVSLPLFIHLILFGVSNRVSLHHPHETYATSNGEAVIMAREMKFSKGYIQSPCPSCRSFNNETWLWAILCLTCGNNLSINMTVWINISYC